MSTVSTDAEVRGRIAWLSGKGKSTNPFPRHSIAAVAWVRGYFEESDGVLGDWSHRADVQTLRQRRTEQTPGQRLAGLHQ